MDYRLLGRSGLKVSPICLGTMMFGGRTDAPTGDRITAKAGAAGINFIDPADAYNDGGSEKVVGAAIAKQRDRWILATKLSNAMGDGPNQRGLSRKWVIEACDASLTRLGTDYIDVFYLHKEDLDTPLETTVSAMGDLIRQGKIRHFGVSNYRSWRVAAVAASRGRPGIHRPAVSPPHYNAMNRQPATEPPPACA